MFFTKTKTVSMTMEQAKQELDADKSIILLDVRTPEEYAQGHIPGSVNIPLDQAKSISERFPDLSERLFVYCQSGMRSRTACGIFSKLGYSDVTNIGGISTWSGRRERD